MNIYQMPRPVLAHRPGTDSRNGEGRSFPRETISRHHRFGADLVLVRRSGLNELHITIKAEPGDTVSTMVTRMRAILEEHAGVVARMEVFGALAAHIPFRFTLLKEMGETSWPVTWVEADGAGNGAIVGIHIFALAGVEVEPLRIGNRVAGCMFNDAYARHCLLGEIVPVHARMSRPEQAREVFEEMQTALEMAGFGVNDIARTWFYLDRSLDWQNDFQRAHDEFNRHRRDRSICAPASTQVIAPNPYGAALSASAWATIPASSAMNVHAISSPLQGGVSDHGLTSAPGMEWNTPGHRRITISSTGSFGFGGELLHKGDIHAQVDLAMEVIEAMLVSRGLDFSDVTRATAYVKLPRHAEALEDWFKRHGMRFPALTTRAQFCRDDLLFEMELDAVMQKPAGVQA